MTWKPEDEERWKSLTLVEVENAICEKEPNHFLDHKDWARDCHTVSIAIVKSGLFEQARVARGSCRGVMGQHSWVVLGDDCYDETAPILDATLWSYDDTKPVLWRGTMEDDLHRPHGWGSIWEYGKPCSTGGEPIEVEGLSASAKAFMDILGPLDLMGWRRLIHAPVSGWPSTDIITAAYHDKRLSALIPIDIVGMLTDENPGGLYLPGGEKESVDA